MSTEGVPKVAAKIELICANGHRRFLRPGSRDHFCCPICDRPWEYKRYLDADGATLASIGTCPSPAVKALAGPRFVMQCSRGHLIQFGDGDKIPASCPACGPYAGTWIRRTSMTEEGITLLIEDIESDTILPRAPSASAAVKALAEQSDQAQRTCQLVRARMLRQAAEIWNAAADYAEREATHLESTRNEREAPEALRVIADAFREAADELLNGAPGDDAQERP
jgi:hypothetical protein